MFYVLDAPPHLTPAFSQIFSMLPGETHGKLFVVFFEEHLESKQHSCSFNGWCFPPPWKGLPGGSYGRSHIF